MYKTRCHVRLLCSHDIHCTESDADRALKYFNVCDERGGVGESTGSTRGMCFDRLYLDTQGRCVLVVAPGLCIPLILTSLCPAGKCLLKGHEMQTQSCTSHLADPAAIPDESACECTEPTVHVAALPCAGTSLCPQDEVKAKSEHD